MPPPASRARPGKAIRRAANASGPNEGSGAGRSTTSSSGGVTAARPSALSRKASATRTVSMAPAARSSRSKDQRATRKGDSSTTTTAPAAARRPSAGARRTADPGHSSATSR